MLSASHLDLAIIGSGPAGLAAAVKARQLGIKDLVVFERDQRPGGILPQCIHNGFGLEKFKEALTGPEYANRYIKMTQAHDIDIQLNTMVLEIEKDRTLTAVSEGTGLKKYKCRSIILALGCRERPRGAIGIPGTRPAGIFTAGQAQRLVNIEGYLPGENIVIQGSGDVGMIMARRLTLEGAKVRAVAEILPYTRHDFDIPLLLGHTVAEIHGDKRVEGVTLVEVDADWNPIADTARHLACDTLLLSVGLIPENELSRKAGVVIDPQTGGPYVNDMLETSAEGIFSCVKGKMPGGKHRIVLKGDSTIGQVVPQTISGLRPVMLYIRVKRPMPKMTLRIGGIFEKRFPYARPSEMIRIRLPGKIFSDMKPGVKRLDVTCQER